MIEIRIFNVFPKHLKTSCLLFNPFKGIASISLKDSGHADTRGDIDIDT